jgi:Tol biopolymer transport system component
VLVDDVAQTPNTAAGQFGISQTGSLLYVSGDLGSTARQLVWVDRQGHEGPSLLPIRSYQQPRLSPDGQRLVISSAANIWLWTFASETLMRLTNESAVQYNPIWTPDGRYVVFDSNDGGGTIQIVRKAADGTGATTLVTAAPAGFPDSVSTDGKALIFHTLERVAMVVPLEAKAQARPLLPDVKGPSL